jgi:hypothetical protein
MTAEQHDQLVKLLAYHASCVAGAQSDAQPVVVRSERYASCCQPLGLDPGGRRRDLGSGEDTAR